MEGQPTTTIPAMEDTILQSTVLSLSLLGVSVHWLATGFFDEIRNAGCDGNSKIYDLEPLQGYDKPGVIRQKGMKLVSPVDGRLGSSYVHCLEGEDNVGPAKYMLSYSWGYSIGDVAATLTSFCTTYKLNPKRTYIWIDCLCINQHRVVEQKEKGGTGLMNFEQEFPRQLSQIGHMLAMMTPWKDPLYLKRVWCVFEIYTAHECGCNVTIVMPPEERIALRDDAFGRQGNLDELYHALSRTRVQTAKATHDSDREMILSIIENTMGCEPLNNWVNDFLRAWVRDILEEMMEQIRPEEKGCDCENNTEFDRTDWMTIVSEFYYRNRELDKAEQLLRRIIDIRESINHPKVAHSYTKIARILWKMGKHDRSFDFCTKAAARLEAEVEVDHYRTSVAYGGIGNALAGKGDYESALVYYQKALSIREIKLGSTHPSTAASHSDIALVYYRQGRYDETLARFQQVLSIQESVLGREHPQTATTYHRIGDALFRRGDRDEALTKYKKALAIRECLLGKGHPDTVISRDSIEKLLQDRDER